MKLQFMRTIHELRKVASKNKKYKYIYQLVVNGQVVDTRHSVIDYAGCIVEDNRAKSFFGEKAVRIASLKNDVALTFESLLKLSNL